MNDFTKEELEALADCYEQRMNSGYVIHLELLHKIQSMIENYQEDPLGRRKIAESHLREAESLISHAMCLLGMKEEE